MDVALTGEQLRALRDGDLAARHGAWWQRRGLLVGRIPQTPLGDLWLPLADGTVAEHDLDLQPEMLDLDRLAGEALAPGPVARHGDLFDVRSPFMRVPWVEAIMGCPIRVTIRGGSMRSQAFVHDWAEWPAHAGQLDARWLGPLEELTRLLVARSGGRYAVAHTLMRGPSDLAEAALGPEMTCLAMYDRPRELQRFLQDAADAFLAVWRAQQSLIPPLWGGWVNWFGIWAPGSVVRTQCDASAFLSPKQYARDFLSHDARIAQAADYAIIHLHSGCLHVAPAICQEERPQAIQVSLDPVPFAPPVSELLEPLARILEHKPLVIDGVLSDDEVQMLLERLPHDGLCIIQRDERVEEA